MADAEYHVASYVVSTRPEAADEVAKRINLMPGLEVHACSDGKLVVTAETDNVRILADVAGRLEQVDSVIAVAPVYHEYTRAEEGAD